MANKGKKLTLVNAGKALKAKTVRRNVKGVDSEGNEVLFYIEVDDKFVDSKLAELGAEFVLTMAYDEEIEDEVPLEDKLVNVEPYLLGLILKHFTSLKDDFDGTFKGTLETVLVLQDYGLWKEVTSALPEGEVNKTFTFIEKFIEDNRENISEALERAKEEIKNNEVLALFDFDSDDEEDGDND